MNNVPSHWHSKRLRAERRFRRCGLAALALAALFLFLLLGSIVVRGLPGFTQAQLRLNVTFDAASIGLAPGQEIRTIPASRFNTLVQQSLRGHFTDVAGEGVALRKLTALVSSHAALQLKRMLVADPGLLSQSRDVWLLASSNADMYFKGHIVADTPEGGRKLSDAQIGWLEALKRDGRVRSAFNETFFSRGDSRAPERAGFLGAMIGSGLTLAICLLVVFPIGVMTAVYLEEFARKGRVVDIIEVNINNLAAVPSIVFGLLGLAIYINLMGLPRSAALVGGMTLALMSLPVIIIAARTSLKAIPDSIRDAARALGASPMQVVWHHTLPLAMPGIMTGTILAMARAIGETAPLLMIGMVAFVADVPDGFTASATVMPVQVYLWASSPETGFAEKTAAGILVLILLLIAMNALAIYLRKKFEVRW